MAGWGRLPPDCGGPKCAWEGCDKATGGRHDLRVKNIEILLIVRSKIFRDDWRSPTNMPPSFCSDLENLLIYHFFPTFPKPQIRKSP
jgi:hypothetical protein